MTSAPSRRAPRLYPARPAMRGNGIPLLPDVPSQGWGKDDGQRRLVPAAAGTAAGLRRSSTSKRPPWQPQQYDPRQHEQRYAYEQVPSSPNPAPRQRPRASARAPQVPQHPPRGRSATPMYAGIALVIGIAIGGAAGYILHGSSPAAANTGSATAGAATASSAPATPDTSAAAKSTAAQFVRSLLGRPCGGAAWQYLTAADKTEAPLSVYTAVHQGCPSEAAGLAYKIQQVNMAGKTAVVTYSLSGVASATGSGTMAETWTPRGVGSHRQRHGHLLARLRRAPTSPPRRPRATAQADGRLPRDPRLMPGVLCRPRDVARRGSACRPGLASKPH